MHSYKRDFDSDSRILLLSSIAAVIGVISTFAAYVLLHLINFFTNLFFFQSFSFAASSPSTHNLGAWVILVPIIGGLIVGLMARFGSDKIRGHGIPEAIEAILYGKSRMSPKVAVLKPLSSGIVIGSGGPFGAEGPIIMTGGAIGSLIAQHFSLSAAERKTLLVAGATAGMTAVFGTPAAAVLLAVELLLFEWRPRSLLPVILACTVAGFARPLLLEPGPLFPLQTQTLGINSLGICILAGVLSGMLSAAMSMALYKIEDIFTKLPIHWMWWPALGAIAVGIGGYFEPRALGVGYDVISDLLNHRIVGAAVLSLLAVKAIIWMVALGSGTSGGVLAPLLMLGAGLGSALSYAFPHSDPSLWPLVCMAAMLAGVLGAPLTAATFAVGLTGDFNALLPLLLATGVSYGFTVLVMRRSIMTEKIARRGRHVYREYGVDPMERTHAVEIMSTNIVSISSIMSIGEVEERYFRQHQPFRSYPVVDAGGRYLGIVDRELIQRFLADHAARAPIGDLLTDIPATVLPEHACRIVATYLARHGIERIAVINNPQQRKLVGLISRSDLIKTSLHLYEEEHQREKLIDWLPRLFRDRAS